MRNLVRERDRIRVEVNTVIEKAAVHYGMDQKERFWTQAAALTVYGGHLAREWGLIEFNPDVIKPWLLSETRRMRSNLQECEVTSESILSQFLNETLGERLVISKVNQGMSAQHMRPTREISQRYERDTQILYIATDRIRKYLGAAHFNYNDVKDDLYAKGILTSANIKKTLTSGTDFGGGQVPCWKIKADSPELGALLVD